MAVGDTPTVSRTEAMKGQFFDVLEGARTRAGDIKDTVREKTGIYAAKAQDSLTQAGKETYSFLGKRVDYLTSHETTAVMSTIGALLYFPQKVAVHTRIQKYLVPVLLLAFPVKVALSLGYKGVRWTVNHIVDWRAKSLFHTKLYTQIKDAEGQNNFRAQVEKAMAVGYSFDPNEEKVGYINVMKNGRVIETFETDHVASYANVVIAKEVAEKVEKDGEAGMTALNKLASVAVGSEDDKFVSPEAETVLAEVNALGFDVRSDTGDNVYLSYKGMVVSEGVDVGAQMKKYLGQAEVDQDWAIVAALGGGTDLTGSVMLRKRT